MRFPVATTSAPPRRSVKSNATVYDISQRATFENIDNWLRELHEHGEKDIQVIILGNKCDLEDQRQVTTEDGRSLAEKRGLFFMETSAKTNADDCVDRAFQVLLDEITRKLELEEVIQKEKMK